MSHVAAPMRVHKDGVDMAFEMIDRDEWFGERIGQGLRVKDADQQRSGQAWTLGYGDGIEFFEGDARLLQRGAYHRHEVTEMFARGEFGDDAAIPRVQRNLAGDDIRQDFRARTHNGRRGFIATAFDAEDEFAWGFGHLSIVERAANGLGTRYPSGVRRNDPRVLFRVPMRVPSLEEQW